MNTKIKLINIAVLCNHFGNFLIGFAGYKLIVHSAQYIGALNNIIKDARNELIDNNSLIQEDEFTELELRSREKAREDLITLYFGITGRDLYKKYIINFYNKPI